MNPWNPSKQDSPAAAGQITVLPKDKLYPLCFRVFKDCMNVSSPLVVAVVNTIFGTHHDLSSQVIFEEEAFQVLDGCMQVLPICILEKKDGVETPFRYCIGFQLDLDAETFIELYLAAMRQGWNARVEVDENTFKLQLPYAAIICLWDPDDFGDECTIHTIGQNGEEDLPFQIVIVNLFRRTLAENADGLLPLLPFEILRHYDRFPAASA